MNTVTVVWNDPCCAFLQAIIEIISNPVNSTVPIASEILKAAGEGGYASAGPEQHRCMCSCALVRSSAE
jgi:hypothetical protein